MQELKLMRKGYFPFRKLKIEINNKSFLLRGNESIDVNLVQNEFNIIMKMDWWKSNKKVRVGEDTKLILVKFCLPDLFFVIGFVSIFVLAVATFLLKINFILLTAALLIFILPQFYFLFIKKDTYFNIKLNK